MPFCLTYATPFSLFVFIVVCMPDRAIDVGLVYPFFPFVCYHMCNIDAFYELI